MVNLNTAMKSKGKLWEREREPVDKGSPSNFASNIKRI